MVVRKTCTKSPFLGAKLWNWLIDTRNILSRCRLKLCAFAINHTSRCSLCSNLSIYHISSVYLLNYLFQLPKNATWIDKISTHVIGRSTVNNRIALIHHISLESTVTYVFYCIIRNNTWKRTIRQSFKKIVRQLLFLRNHLKQGLQLNFLWNGTWLKSEI